MDDQDLRAKRLKFFEEIFRNSTKPNQRQKSGREVEPGNTTHDEGGRQRQKDSATEKDMDHLVSVMERMYGSLPKPKIESLAGEKMSKKKKVILNQEVCDDSPARDSRDLAPGKNVDESFGRSYPDRDVRLEDTSKFPVAASRNRNKSFASNESEGQRLNRLIVQSLFSEDKTEVGASDVSLQILSEERQLTGTAAESAEPERLEAKVSDIEEETRKGRESPGVKELELLNYFRETLGISDVKVLRKVIEILSRSNVEEKQNEEVQKDSSGKFRENESSIHMAASEVKDLPLKQFLNSSVAKNESRKTELTDYSDAKVSDLATDTRSQKSTETVLNHIFSQVSEGQAVENEVEALEKTRNNRLITSEKFVPGLDERITILNFKQTFPSQKSSREVVPQEQFHVEKYESGQSFLEAMVATANFQPNSDPSRRLYNRDARNVREERGSREKSHSVDTKNKGGFSATEHRPSLSLSGKISREEHYPVESAKTFFDEELKNEKPPQSTKNKRRENKLPYLEPFFPDTVNDDCWLPYTDDARSEESSARKGSVRSRSGSGRGGSSGSGRGGSSGSGRGGSSGSNGGTGHQMHRNKPYYNNKMASNKQPANVTSSGMIGQGKKQQTSRIDDELKTLRDGLIHTNDNLLTALTEIEKLKEENTNMRKRLSFYERQFSSNLFCMQREVQSRCNFTFDRGGLLWSANFSSGVLAAINRAEIPPWQESPTYFFPNNDGYAMVMEFYPLGFGVGKGSHASVYWRLVPSKNDAKLAWPFTAKVTFVLLPAVNGGNAKPVIYTTQVCSYAAVSKRPSPDISNVNDGWGVARFVRQNLLHSSDYSTKGRVQFRMCVHV